MCRSAIDVVDISTAASALTTPSTIRRAVLALVTALSKVATVGRLTQEWLASSNGFKARKSLSIGMATPNNIIQIFKCLLMLFNVTLQSKKGSLVKQ